MHVEQVVQQENFFMVLIMHIETISTAMEFILNVKFYYLIVNSDANMNSDLDTKVLMTISYGKLHECIRLVAT